MLWNGVWLTGIEFEQHNDLAGLQGGQAEEYYHLDLAEYNQLPTYDAHLTDGTIHFLESSISHLNILDIGTNSHADIDSFISAVPTTYLKLDCTNDPLTGTLNTQSIIPNVSAIYDLGESTTPLRWRTLYLGNDGGTIVDIPTALESKGAGGGATDYTFELGGGFTGIGTGGGVFNFIFDTAVAGGENILKFNLGGVWYAGGAGISNDFIIECDSGLDNHRFIAKFGGFSNPEYGWALDRKINIGDPNGKTLFFDNQDTISDARRSIDLRIAGTNIMTIENDQTVDFPLQNITAPNGIIINGYCTIQGSTVFNLYDVFTVKPQNPVNADVGGVFALRPSGTSPTTANLCINDEDLSNYAAFENSISGQIARLATWDIGTGLSATELRIGEMASAFFGVGADTALLTTIDFYFANAIEMQIQPDTIIFNNGAVDTQIDWATSGQLGLQVATNDIIRISSALAHIYQNTDVDGDVWLTSDNDRVYLGAGKDVDFYYDGTYCYLRTDLQNPSDLRLDCGTNKTLELQETVWDDLRIIPGAFEFAGTSDPSLENWQPGGSGPVFKIRKFKSGDEVFFTCQIPHGYKEGTNIGVHLHWTPADRGNEESGNTVAWKLDYSWANRKAVFPSGSTADMTDTCTGTDDYHEVTASIPITGTGKTISGMLTCRLYRDAGDTWAGITGAQSPGILEDDIHFEADTMGSRQEGIK